MFIYYLNHNNKLYHKLLTVFSQNNLLGYLKKILWQDKFWYSNHTLSEKHQVAVETRAASWHNLEIRLKIAFVGYIIEWFVTLDGLLKHIVLVLLKLKRCSRNGYSHHPYIYTNNMLIIKFLLSMFGTSFIDVHLLYNK